MKILKTGTKQNRSERHKLLVKLRVTLLNLPQMLDSLVVSLEVSIQATKLAKLRVLLEATSLLAHHSGANLVYSVVVLVVRDIEYRLLHALVEQLLECVHLLGWRKRAILLDKLTHIDRLTHLHTCRRAETEEVTVAQTYRNDVEWHIGHKFLRLEGDAEDTL